MSLCSAGPRGGAKYAACKKEFAVSENHPAFSVQDGVLYKKDFTSVEIVPYGIKGDIAIPGGIEYISSNDFGDRPGLTSVVLSEGIRSIYERGFENCTGLTSLSLPASLSSIGVGAIAGCDNIERISVAQDSPYFRSQNGLLIKIKNDDQQEAIWISRKTSGAVTVPEGITSIGGSVFLDCSGVTSVTLPASVTSIGYGAFTGCNQVTINFLGSTDEWEAVDKNEGWRDGTSVKEVVCKNGTLSGNDIG